MNPHFPIYNSTFSSYYPFGMLQPNRNGGEYSFGYQGSEADDEIKGKGNSYTTFFRGLDPRLGRWLSIDPKASELPHQSPYSSMDNNPVWFNDPMGDKVETDYGLAGDGSIVQIGETNDEKDRLFKIDNIIDKNIIDPSNFEEFSSSGVLSKYDIAKEEYKSAGGMHKYEKEVKYLKTNQKDDAFKLFYFAANNTHREWGLIGYKNSEGNKDYVVLTGLNPEGTPHSYSFEDINVHVYDMQFHIHSHHIQTGDFSTGALKNGASGYDNAPINTDEDQFNIHKSWFESYGLKLPKHYVYQKTNKTLYNYNSNKGDIYIRKIPNYKRFYFGNF